MKPHQRLSEAMNQRRLDLGLNWKEVALAAGIAPESIHAIRRGANRPSELTMRGLDKALQWPRGTAQAILEDRAVPADREGRLIEKIQIAASKGEEGAAELLVAIHGPPADVAQLAVEAGVPPEEFEGFRDDVAEAIRELERAPEEAPTDDLVKRAQELMQEGVRLIEQAQRLLGERGIETDESDRGAG